jgi:hypothetical protein
LQGQTLTLPQRQQLPPPRRVLTSGRYRTLYPGRSAQTGLRLPRRRRNNRLPGVPRRPRGQIQALAQPMTPARVAGPGSPNGVTEVGCLSIAFLEMDELLRIARIAQSVTPVTVIHSTANAQSRVATLHLIVHELIAFLLVLVAIAMPAPHGIGDQIGHGAAVRLARRTQHPTRAGRRPCMLSNSIIFRS